MLLTEPISRRQDDAPANPGLDAETLAENLSLAKSLAWKFARGEGRRVPVDELFAEALFGLAYANHLFDPSRNVPFKKYAIMVICHRLRHLIAGFRRREREVPLPRLAHAPEEEWQPAAPEAGEDAGRDLDAVELWDRVRRSLPRRQYELLRLHYETGCSLAQIGRRLGVSRQRVSQLFGRAMTRLRLRWED